MFIFTDNLEFSNAYFGNNVRWQETHLKDIDDNLKRLANNLLFHDKIYIGEAKSNSLWQYCFAVENSQISQFDLLIELMNRDHCLPCGTLCIAGTGANFHGFKKRSWEALSGNIHLSCCLKPMVKMDNISAGFIILAAISVLETLCSIEKLADNIAIKWINDIMLNDGKVAGVLAHTQMQGDIMTGAVLGIGLNVEKLPYIKPTPFVPKAACVWDYVKNKKLYNLNHIFDNLIDSIAKNYDLLLSGNYKKLLRKYRKYSIVIGKNVIVIEDSESEKPNKIIEGKVVSIGDNLELNFEGYLKPITKGRLIV